MVIGIAVVEIVLALLVAWVLLRTRDAGLYTPTGESAASGWLVLGAMLACLAFFVFTLACWQWRLSARARLRLLLVMFVSLAWAFCTLCWRDVARQTAALDNDPALKAARAVSEPPLTSQRSLAIEQSAADAIATFALAAGLVGVTATLWLDRRSPKAEDLKGQT